jgi:hypothetical protein
MKTIIKMFKIAIIVVEALLLVICASEIYEFSKDSNSYHLGSEAMVENGGWSYSSNFNFIFFNSIMVILSILLSFFAFRSKKIKFLLLILLLVICQIACFVFL